MAERTFTFDTRELDAAVRKYQSLGQPIVQALTRTVNRVGQGAGNVAKKRLAKEMGLSQGDTGTYLRISKATWGNITWTMNGSGRPISLNRFGAVQRQAGVSARPWGRRRIFRGTFISPELGDHVYERIRGKVLMMRGKYKGRYREPIRKLWGPSIPKVMAEEAVVTAFRDSVKSDMPARLEHEIGFALRQLGSRAR
jgi:hypothetical protein